MTAVLRDDPPDLTGSRSELSPALDRIVRHCLEKQPAERFQTARDVAFALEALSGSGTATAAAAVQPDRRRRRVVPVAAAGIVLLALAIGGFIGYRLADSSTRPPATFTAKTVLSQSIYNARFMPDGRTIVYAAALEGPIPDVFILHPNDGEPQRIATGGLFSVSSKGELALLTTAAVGVGGSFVGTLARMTLGSAPRAVLEQVRDADWSPDGASLAVVHSLAGKDGIEYPIGTRLYETAIGRRLRPRDGTRPASLSIFRPRLQKTLDRFPQHHLKGERNCP